MVLAPLTTGPHLVPANRLAFTTPVREAGGAGHWITLHSAEDPESGTCHVWVNGGSGPGSGTIGKGPKSLVGQHIAALASHPSVSKAQHHPVGHEPPGARDHPHYTEAPPTTERPPHRGGDPANAGPEAAKRPGKPYARLHGAEQGTRAEQIGKALSEAQGAARGAKAAQGQESDEDKLARLTSAMKDHETRANLARFTDRSKVAHHEAEHQRLRGEVQAHRASMDKAGESARAVKPLTAKAGAEAPTAGDVDHDAVEDFMAAGEAASSEKRQQMLQQVRAAVKARKPAMGVNVATLAEMQRRLESPEHKVADTAVAHQQAQADLAAHRSKADRNPNPWAPHLSPPVGDAKDRELAEKATRAQLAHQAAQAQQQGAQQQQQQEGQRTHEKEMVRLKAETAAPKPEVAPLQAKAAPAPAHDEAHVATVMQAHAGKDTAEQGKYRDFMQRVANGDTYRPTMQDGRPLTKASASEALRRMNGEAPRQAADETSTAEQPAKVRPSKPSDKPWDYVSPAAQKRMDAAKAEQSRKKADEDRRNLEGALIHNAAYAHHAFTRDQAQSHAAMQDRLMAEHREKHGDEANRQLKDLMDTARYAGRGYEGYRNASELVRQDVDAARHRQQQPKAEPKPAFTAPAAKEKPQTAPQPEQPAGAPVPSQQHREALRDGRRLLAQKTLDPEAHKAKVDAAVHKATAADAFEGARVGYARHGSEYAQRLAHLEAASHYQNHADALQRQHLALTNQDTGGALGKAQRHIEVLTHHEQRAQGQTHPESDQQARDLLARSQAIGRHYTSAVQHLNAKAQEHRDAHARLRRTQPVRESATPTRFSAPAAR